MLTGRKTKGETKTLDIKPESNSGERLKIKRKYEKEFLLTALKLCLYQIKHRVLSSAADFIFSGKNQKATKFLMFANRAISRNISKCQITAEKCERYRQTIANI
ncbi:MAG: hypothetical protein FWH10_09395 [Oscillospiraceae bacterium]|nr:hypothetical protein [Oscillospiraceae bacterium]